MIEELFARRIFENKNIFSDVPDKLKEKVKEILKNKYNKEV